MSSEERYAGDPTVPPSEDPSVPGAVREGGGREPAPGEPTHAHFEDPVLLEEDETVPPRPEEEVADVLRAEPDPH
jgi:hypothetical protein